MSSDISYCIYCGEPIPKGQVICKKCYDKDQKQAYEFGIRYHTTP